VLLLGPRHVSGVAPPISFWTISSQVSQPDWRKAMPPAQLTTVPVWLTNAWVSPPFRDRNCLASKLRVVLPPSAVLS